MVLYNNRLYTNNNGVKYLLNQDDYSTLNNIINTKECCYITSYTGNRARNRNITLTVNPKILFLFDSNNFYFSSQGTDELNIFISGTKVQYNYAAGNTNYGSIMSLNNNIFNIKFNAGDYADDGSINPYGNMININYCCVYFT